MFVHKISLNIRTNRSVWSHHQTKTHIGVCMCVCVCVCVKSNHTHTRGGGGEEEGEVGNKNPLSKMTPFLYRAQKVDQLRTHFHIFLLYFSPSSALKSCSRTFCGWLGFSVFAAMLWQQCNQGCTGDLPATLTFPPNKTASRGLVPRTDFWSAVF